MLKNILFWFLSLAVTVSFAVFQRMTGPTYPLKGKIEISGKSVEYKFPRSCTVSGSCALRINTTGDLSAYAVFKRYKTDEPLSASEFEKKDGFYEAVLPDQPAAGKLAYDVLLKEGGRDIGVNQEPVIVRFKGAVPSLILIPHVLFMFLFMFFSVKIFLSGLVNYGPVKHAVYLNYFFLLAGGFFFGPLTQRYAFGEYWTGFPFGYDLTDNKTLIMLVFWTPAVLAVWKGRNHKFWINFAFAVTALVYFTPHSLFGSELDYSKVR